MEIDLTIKVPRKQIPAHEEETPPLPPGIEPCPGHGIPMTEEPFIGFVRFGPYYKKGKKYRRWNYRLIKKIEGKVIADMTLSIARYLMTIKLGKIIPKELHVDHIDEDKRGDRIENLQLLTNRENRIKSYKNRKKCQRHYDLICPVCGKKFSCERNQLYLLRKKRAYKMCSVACANVFQGAEFKAIKDKLLPPEKYIIRERRISKY